MLSAEPDMNPEPETRARTWFSEGTVETLEEASWCARKLRKYRQSLAEIEALYDAEKARLDRWVEAERSRIGADATRFEIGLESWHRRRLMAGDAGKTIRLPAATLKARTRAARVEVREPEVLVQWAEENRLTDLVRTKKEPVKKAVDAYVKESGDLPPGCELAPETTEFTVTTEADDAAV